MAEEEEVLAEVDAVRSVYGDDCRVIREYPPHLAVRICPRTADVSSQQFVEAVLGIEAGLQYPEVPPCISILDSKGLDLKRQEYLIASVKIKAEELSSCLMIIALYETAVEILSAMNHPDGGCPLCLNPLFPDDKRGVAVPFMKLMSCFHCFHSVCIIRWWRWLQEQNNSAAQTQLANCPVCRQKFSSKDIEHVLDLLEAEATILSLEGDTEDEKEILESDLQKSRREKFNTLLEMQRNKGGLVEPHKAISIAPGMYLQEPPCTPAAQPSVADEQFSGGMPTSESATEITSNKPAAVNMQRRPPPPRRGRHSHPRKERNGQSSQTWVQKRCSSS